MFVLFWTYLYKYFVVYCWLPLMFNKYLQIGPPKSTELILWSSGCSGSCDSSDSFLVSVGVVRTLKPNDFGDRLLSVGQVPLGSCGCRPQSGCECINKNITLRLEVVLDGTSCLYTFDYRSFTKQLRLALVLSAARSEHEQRHHWQPSLKPPAGINGQWLLIGPVSFTRKKMV